MTVYLDTNSLIKLYVAEPGTDAVRQLTKEAAILATSFIAYPETRAALARRRRERALSAAAFTTAKRTFEADGPKYLTIEVSASLCREAGELAERYGLRGYDGVHLASFAEVARHAGARQTRFSSCDDNLNRAAASLRRRLERAR